MQRGERIFVQLTLAETALPSFDQACPVSDPVAIKSSRFLWSEATLAYYETAVTCFFPVQDRKQLHGLDKAGCLLTVDAGFWHCRTLHALLDYFSAPSLRGFEAT